MPKLAANYGKAVPYNLQKKIDKLDIVGKWKWNINGDRVFTDTVVALLFNVDPSIAENGASLTNFLNGIHPEDRSVAAKIFVESAKRGTSYVSEYRVCSADGVIRWILSRGRFELDLAGRPACGRGILVDITQSKVSEDAFSMETSAPPSHPLERIADHCLAICDEAEALQDSLVRQLANMLLIEAGRTLAEFKAAERRKRMN